VPKEYDPAASNGSVENWLDRLGITPQADKYPAHVSGGQRQRAAIARTLVLNPDLLLMDEPFSSLDAPTREGLQAVVGELQRETGITVLLVTHSIEEAVFMGRKILVLGPELPTYRPHIIDNPDASSPGYRSSVAYMERCAILRKLMGLQD
jgi:ABC-type nitrate/sulfonate/bicarbonate transport system ATPase subunit